MTTVYLAYCQCGSGTPTFRNLDWDLYPLNVLVSFVYLNQWRKLYPGPRPPKLMLDSGAFTAYKTGKKININALIAEGKSGVWDEAVALDVIGDGWASLTNARLMRDAGSPAFPVFHVGEPWDLLKVYCDEFQKVGLSCRFGEPKRDSLRFLDGCFGRHWPHRFHSFGWVDEVALRRYPFHSADASTWVLGPNAFGRWKAFSGRRLPVSGQKNLTAEADAYLRLQADLRRLWRRELGRFYPEGYPDDRDKPRPVRAPAAKLAAPGEGVQPARP